MFTETRARAALADGSQQFASYKANHDAKAADTTKTIDVRNEAAKKAAVNDDWRILLSNMATEPGYHELAMRTAAGPEVLHLPTDEHALECFVLDTVHSLLEFSRAAARLDRLKSILFYGKDKGHRTDEQLLELLGLQDTETLTFTGVPPQLLHALLGIGSEAGELAEDLIKAFAKGVTDDLVDNIVRESGDVDWFQELLAHSVGVTVEEGRGRNIERLQKRFPNAFSEAAAIERADEFDVQPGGGRIDDRRGKIVIVFGPPASGKTRNKDAMLSYFGCTKVVDDWDGTSLLKAGDLALTSVVVDLRQLNVAKVTTDPGVAVEAYSIDRILEEMGNEAENGASARNEEGLAKFG